VKKLQSKGFNLLAILLGGPVDYDMYKNFRSQLDGAQKEGLVVTELPTLGGDPEVARMMGEDRHPRHPHALVMRDALQSTLANCRFLQPTLTGIAEDSGRVSRHIPMATAAADFGK
jgi:hypothetical protein